MSQLTTNVELAKIAISKNLIKEYNDSKTGRNVYLKDGTEFQIYIKNPHPYHVGIKIYVNDKFIGNTLVLRPGQSVWLERYLDNDSKFLFSTYEVEDSAEMHYAISHNGVVKIEFYKEKEKVQPVYRSCQALINGGGNLLFNDSVLRDSSYGSSTIAYNCSDSTLDLNSLTAKLNCECGTTIKSAKSLFSTGTNIGAEVDMSATRVIQNSKTMETGRVERGSHSDQKFDTVNIDFEYWPFQTETITILPASRKAATVEDVRRKYCSNCGKKVKPSDKFCSGCGHKLD